MATDRDNCAETHIKKNQYQAVQEAFVNFIVGVFPKDGQGTGTGTLVKWRSRQFLLTACHVLDGVEINEVRFHTRQASPIERINPEETLRKYGPPTRRGEHLHTLGVVAKSDEDHDDLAVLELGSLAGIEAGAEFYELPDSNINISEGASVLTVGYAFENAIEFAPGHRGIVATDHMEGFNSSLNGRVDLHSCYNCERHFLLPYDGLKPHGFSGAGAWCNIPPSITVWTARPMLIGVVTRWHRQQNLLQITSLRSILELFRQIG